MRDIHLEGKINDDNPFYVMELGTGSGKFSFYVIKHLNELVQESGLDFCFTYVMTDFTENNLAYWKTHPALMPYVEQGCLDFAIYNGE